jgi:DNA-binding NtrC family response regulator
MHLGSPPLQAMPGNADFAMPQPTQAPNSLAGVQATAPRNLATPTQPLPSSIQPLEDMEREQIVRTLGQFNGNRTHTAQALGIGVRTLGLKLKKWKEQNLVAQTI